MTLYTHLFIWYPTRLFFYPGLCTKPWPSFFCAVRLGGPHVLLPVSGLSDAPNLLLRKIRNPPVRVAISRPPPLLCPHGFPVLSEMSTFPLNESLVKPAHIARGHCETFPRIPQLGHCELASYVHSTLPPQIPSSRGAYPVPFCSLLIELLKFLRRFVKAFEAFSTVVGTLTSMFIVLHSVPPCSPPTSLPQFQFLFFSDCFRVLSACFWLSHLPFPITSNSTPFC